MQDRHEMLIPKIISIILTEQHCVFKFYNKNNYIICDPMHNQTSIVLKTGTLKTFEIKGIILSAFSYQHI